MVDETKTLRPSAGKAKEAVDGPGNDNYLEGLSSSELTMIRRLAGNDPNIRKKTMRKLRKWLSAIANKIPDTPESRDLVVPNFVRVWKALFYCMWMADKPLPQEQLAEQISNLLNIFARKQNIMIIFIDWFFLTVAREWSWIDRFRLDKFMMLIRRFLRKSLEQLSLRDWNKDILTQFVQIISNNIFNRHPPTKKTRSRAKIPDHPKAPLGFQIHFTDIFLEELAKVGAETLKSESTLELLSPFIFELAHNDDDRLLTEIRERIFIHLIKQSDAAFDYMEGGIESSDDEESDEDDNGGEEEEEMDDNDAEDQDIEQEESDNEEMDYNQPLDPRAGQVDVILPQLQISYDKLAVQLVESGGQKDVKGKNKKILFALARSMNELTEGNYPLALPDSGPRAPAISKKEVMNATKRLASLHDELVGDKEKVKKKKSALVLPDPGPSAPVVSKKAVKSATKRPASPDNEVLGNKTKKKKLTLASPESGTTDSTVSTNEIKITPKRLSSQDDELTGNKINKKTSPLASPVSSPKKSPAISKKESGSNTPISKKMFGANTPISKKESSPNTSISKNKSSPSTPPNSPKKEAPIANKQLSSLGGELGNKPKRVSFVLARNSEHPHADYQDSIQRSPAIPFDSKKQPNGGLLKARSPATPTLKGYVIPKRKKAADFF